MEVNDGENTPEKRGRETDPTEVKRRIGREGGSKALSLATPSTLSDLESLKKRNFSVYPSACLPEFCRGGFIKEIILPSMQKGVRSLSGLKNRCWRGEEDKGR